MWNGQVQKGHVGEVDLGWGNSRVCGWMDRELMADGRLDVILLRSLGWASHCRLAGGKEKCLLQQWTGGNGLRFWPTLVLDYQNVPHQFQKLQLTLFGFGALLHKIRRCSSRRYQKLFSGLFKSKVVELQKYSPYLSPSENIILIWNQISKKHLTCSDGDKIHFKWMLRNICPFSFNNLGKLYQFQV